MQTSPSKFQSTWSIVTGNSTIQVTLTATTIEQEDCKTTRCEHWQKVRFPIPY